MKHTIWQNFDIDVEDWKDFLEEECPEVTDEYEQYRLCAEMNDEYLGDERANLDVDVPTSIVAFADMGLWHGRRDGWRVLWSQRNISDVLDFDLLGRSVEYAEWFVDDGDLQARGAHHDGTNWYVFRRLRDDLTDDDLERIESLEVTSEELMDMTVSLAPDVCNVYGWECECAAV